MKELIKKLHHFLESCEYVAYKAEIEGVFTVITSGINSDMIRDFNRWNELNGIQYSLVRIKYDGFILYPSNGGVTVLDLVD